MNVLRRPLSRYQAGSYIAAATIAGLAAVLVVAKVGGFDLTGSSTYLLPALAAGSLGTAIVTPGQFSPTGKVPWNLLPRDGHRRLERLGGGAWVHDSFYELGPQSRSPPRPRPLSHQRCPTTT